MSVLQHMLTTFENIEGKAENGNQHFLFYFTTISNLPKTDFCFWETIILSSANPFNLDYLIFRHVAKT